MKAVYTSNDIIRIIRLFFACEILTILFRILTILVKNSDNMQAS